MRQPFFILGTARCGSTRLWQILDAHPRVFVTNEGRIIDVVNFFAIYSGLPKASRRRFLLDEEFELRGVIPPKHVELFSDVVRGHARSMIEEFYTRAAGDPEITHWGDKLPDVEAARAVLEILPATRYVALVRDPRDAWTSWQHYIERKEVAAAFPASSSIDVGQFARNWRNLYQATTAWFPSLLQLRFEDLVLDTRRTIEAVFDHLGLDWHSDVDAEIAADTKLQHHATASSPAASVRRWETDLAAPDRDTIESICEPLMRSFGYEV